MDQVLEGPRIAALQTMELASDSGSTADTGEDSGAGETTGGTSDDAGGTSDGTTDSGGTSGGSTDGGDGGSSSGGSTDDSGTDDGSGSTDGGSSDLVDIQLSVLYERVHPVIDTSSGFFIRPDWITKEQNFFLGGSLTSAFSMLRPM